MHCAHSAGQLRHMHHYLKGLRLYCVMFTLHFKINMQCICVKTGPRFRARSLTSSFPSVMLSRCSEVQSFLLFLLSVPFILVDGGWETIYNSNVSMNPMVSALDGKTSLVLIHGGQTSPQLWSTNTKTEPIVTAGSTPWLLCWSLVSTLSNVNNPSCHDSLSVFPSNTVLSSVLCNVTQLNYATLARQISRRNSLAR